MSYYKMPVADLLNAAGLVANNAREADLLAALTLVGYDETALTGLDALIAEVSVTKQARETALGGQVGATAGVDDAWEAFYDKPYMVHVGIARAVFRKDVAARATLGLDEAPRRDKAGRYEQALQFYTNALADPAYTAALAVRGMDATVLQAGADAVTAIQKDDFDQDSHIGQAQQSTRDREKAEFDLAEWLSVFRDIARPALKDHPEWLERLGIRHRS